MADIAGRDPSPSLPSTFHSRRRFIDDFARLIRDVDRLMMDVGSIKTDGVFSGPADELSHLISQLRKHAVAITRTPGSQETVHDGLPISYLEFDKKGRILRTNKESTDMLDGAGIPLVGRSLYSFIANTDVPRLREQLANSLKNDRPSLVRITVNKHGKPMPVQLRIRRLTIGSEMGYSAVVICTQDASFTADGSKPLLRDGWATELPIMLSRADNVETIGEIAAEYCMKALESPAGLIFVDRSGELQLVGQWQSKQITNKGLNEEIIKSGPVAEAFRRRQTIVWSQSSTRQAKTSRYLRRILPRSCVGTVAFVPICEHSKQEPVGVVSLVLVQDPKSIRSLLDELRSLGQVLSPCIIRARGYDEVRSALAAAEIANKQKEQSISVIFHELKNSLTPILGWAVALSSRTLPPEKQDIATETIVRSAKALNYLVDDLADSTRMSLGKLQLDVSEMRIQDVAREALSTIQPLAEEKRLRISTDISEAIKPFLADSRRVRQVITNLLHNSVKFTPAGGTIKLKVRRHGKMVECVVSDNGKGIGSQFLPFVFDRFRQEKRSGGTKSSGIGLGLAIVREIIDLHGGTVKAHSQGPDHGAMFVFRLPARRQRPETPHK